jgi:GNAT superfamily N-acetyltransferase
MNGGMIRKLVKDISIVSLKDSPEYKQSLMRYVEDNWRAVYKPFAGVVDEVFWSYKKFPKCYLLLKNSNIIGFYQLIERELIIRKDLTPWITCIFVDEQERGRRLGSKLLEHGRKSAGKLGYPKVYLTTDHIQFYEKFGFKEIGLDKFITGRPTKIYEHDSIK